MKIAYETALVKNRKHVWKFKADRDTTPHIEVTRDNARFYQKG